MLLPVRLRAELGAVKLEPTNLAPCAAITWPRVVCSMGPLDLRWSRFQTMIVLYMCMSIPTAIYRTPMRQTRTRARAPRVERPTSTPTGAPDLNERVNWSSQVRSRGHIRTGCSLAPRPNPTTHMPTTDVGCCRSIAYTSWELRGACEAYT